MSTGKTYSTKYLLDSKNNRGSEGQVLSSTDSGIDWVTLSEISGVDGTGTANYLSKWLDANTITNSLVYDNGTNVGIGTTNPYAYDTTATRLHVKNAGSSGSISEVARLEGASDADGSGAILRIGTSNDRGIYLEGGRVGSVPYASIGTTEYNGAKTEGIRIDSSGKVGIGTTSPNSLLTVVDSGGTGLEFIPQDAYNRNIIFSYKRSASTYKQLVLSANDFSFVTGGVNDRMVIENGGNVGIGTTSPTAKLEVAATATTSVDIAHFSNSNGVVKINHSLDGVGSGKISILDASNNEDIRLSAQGDSWFNAGNVGIGATSPLRKLHVVGDFAVNAGTGEYYGVLINGGESANPKITIGDWHNSSATIHWDSSSNYLRIDSQHSTANAPIAFTGNDGATEYMRITSAGNVGIGTTNPDGQLHVKGSTNRTLKIDSTLVNGTGSFTTVSFARNGNDKWRIWQWGDDRALSFYNEATSSHQLTLKSDGNVGIGTTSPAYKLDVAGGQARIGSSSETTTSLYLTATNLTGAPAIAVRTIMQGYEGRALGTFYTDTTYSGEEWFCGMNYSGGFNRWSVGYDESGGQAEYLANAKFTVFHNGNVGIGIDYPTTKLHIDDNASTGTGLLVTGGGIGAPLAKFTRDVGGSGSIEINSNGSAPQIQFASYANTFALGTNASTFEICDNNFVGTNTRLSITSAGNVGIGTTNPSDNLTVEGGGITLGGTGRIQGVDTVTDATDAANKAYVDAQVGASDTLQEVTDNGNTTTNSITFAGGTSTGDILLGAFNKISGVATDNLVIGVDKNNASGSSSIDFQLDGSTSALFINNSRNVGIGTTNPNTKLEVATSANVNSHGDGAIQVVSSSPIAFVAPSNLNPSLNRWGFTLREGGEGHFGIRDYRHANTRVTIDDSGNVGIGTTNPTSILDIRDTQTGGASEIKLFNLDQGNTTTQTSALVMSPDVRANGVKIAAVKENADFSSSANKDVAITFSPVLNNASAEKMRITSDGNVGIGTTSPDTGLHLYGTSNVSSGFTIEQVYGGTSKKFGFQPVYNDDRLDIWYNSNATAGITLKDGGNVGIGTTNPLGLLQVGKYTVASQGNQGVSGNISSFANSDTNNIFLGLKNGSYPNRGFAFRTVAVGVNSDFTIYEHGQGSAEVFRITSLGKVGIGTTSPDSKLSVTSTSNSSEDLVYLKSGADQIDEYLGIAFETLVGGNGPHAAIRVYNGPSASDSYMSLLTTTNGVTLTQGLTQNYLGNVGIGTTSPAEKLEVNGSIKVGPIKIQNSSAGRIGFNRNTADGAIYNSNYGAAQLQNNAAGQFEIQSYNSSGTYTGVLAIQLADGKVGIGTNSPKGKLHVLDGTAGSYTPDSEADTVVIESSVVGGISLIGTGGGSAQKQKLVFGTTGDTTGAVVMHDPNNSVMSVGTTTASNYLKFLTGNSTEAMRLAANGNVGIGTTSPAAKLDVKGGMSAFETTLTNNYDWQNSAVSILERDNVGSTQSADKYSPNLNFHWSARVSRSLWMNSSGHLNWGSFSSAGIPDAGGVFQTNTLNLIGTGRITGVDTVTDSTDAANKAYVDAQVGSADTLQEVTDNGNTFSADLLYTNSGTAQKIDNSNYNGLMHFNASRNIGFHASTADVAHIHSYSETHFKFGSSHNSANTTAMLIKSDGKVGIGTTSPTADLYINSSNNVGLTLEHASRPTISLTDGTNTGFIGLDNGGAIITGTSDNDLAIRSPRNIVFGGNSIARMSITNAGNVGIGTTSPSTKLDVAGDVKTSTRYLAQTGTSGQDLVMGFWDAANARIESGAALPMLITSYEGNIKLGISGGTTMTVKSTAVGIGTTSPNQKLEVDGNIRLTDYNDDIQFGGTANMLSYNQWVASASGGMRITNSASASTGHIAFETSTGEKVRILRDGNVGINITAPTYKLDVSGGIRAGGKITYHKSAGSLDTTGYAVAGLTSYPTGNGASAGFTFTCFGHTGKYQKIVYSCYNAAGTWNTQKVIDEGTNDFDVVASANGSTVTFTFKSRSGTKNYTPRVSVEAFGSSINNTYA
jgi:hypothetical protein